ncbi:hypothetical protein COU54_03385 [Candidatus Pacearchaeota archaeon CG10_big_fil_rev_8_21_14_0_10_31_24]|nr:MAG: hypothetical protein COU54_03385 [Candidatus Pacearchaeota archaeon CG10_big_fil_rev_8_21_14_0_10_31_24]
MVKNKRKIRVNISVDKELLEKSKSKLNLFGGKLSTLFNAYLKDFVDSIDKPISEDSKEMRDKIKKLEGRIIKIENELK